MIDPQVIDIDTKPDNPGLMPILLLGAVLFGVVFFVLPRFGINFMGLFQKVIAFLPLVRGFLPF